MQYHYNEAAPFTLSNDAHLQQPPVFNINLPGGHNEKQIDGNYIDPTLNFHNLNQNQTAHIATAENSFMNNSFNAPLIQPVGHQNLANINTPSNVQMQVLPPGISMPAQDFNYNQGQSNYQNNNSGFAVGTTVNVVDALIPRTGFEKLMVPGIFVKQKMEWLEIFSGCETENKYKVYACDVAGNKEGQPIFKCREKSGCLQRQCLPGDCRKFRLEVAHDSEGKFSMDGEMFLELVRPFKLTCLCFQRPFVEVNYREGGRNEYIGRIVHNFNLCNMSMTVFDKTNTERYLIKGSIFQIGLMNQRGCPCKGCQQAFCFIHDNTGEIVGIIEKRGKGFKGMISDADNFSILFPIRSTLEERACLLAATLFLDFRYFEDSENNRNNNYY